MQYSPVVAAYENLSKEQFYHINTIAGTFHIDVVVMPVQYPITSNVRPVFLYSLRQNLHLLTGGI